MIEMTLKTLKDMMGNAESGYPRDWVLRRELRQSAIDDIKDFISTGELKFKTDSGLIEFKTKDTKSSGHSRLLIEWIKNKFNITEDDLK